MWQVLWTEMGEREAETGEENGIKIENEMIGRGAEVEAGKGIGARIVAVTMIMIETETMGGTGIVIGTGTGSVTEDLKIYQVLGLFSPCLGGWSCFGLVANMGFYWNLIKLATIAS